MGTTAEARSKSGIKRQMKDKRQTKISQEILMARIKTYELNMTKQVTGYKNLVQTQKHKGGSNTTGSNKTMNKLGMKSRNDINLKKTYRKPKEPKNSKLPGQQTQD